MASISAGVCHSQNLSKLILDLASVNFNTLEEYNKFHGKDIYFFILLVFWVLVIIWYVIAILFFDDTAFQISDVIGFSLLFVQLLILNWWLLNLMNQIFGKTDSKFKSEKRFLISTLIFFSFSYLILVVRNVTAYVAFESTKGGDLGRHGTWVCIDDFYLSLFNIFFYIFSEWLPYMIIFVLNYRNFRTIDQ